MDGDTLQWGLIPNNRWGPIEGAQFGQGIVRTAPRLLFDPPDLTGHCRWQAGNGVYCMDIGLRQYDPKATKSLDDIARKLHGSNSASRHILEELDYIADRLLRYLNHLAKARQPVGLIAPPNAVLVIRDQLDYVEAAHLSRRVTEQKLDKSNLEPDEKNLLDRASQGRFVVLPDLGFSCPPMMSGTPSWLDENHEFHFIWDQPPQEEHVAVLEPWRINRSVARMFAWVLTSRSLKNIPAVSPDERQMIGPCWDVLAKAVNGEYETVEQFRLALQSAPLSTFRFGAALPTTDDQDFNPPRRRWLGCLAVAAVLLLLLGVGIIFLLPSNDVDGRPECCDKVTKAGGEAFYDLLLDYDKLSKNHSPAEASVLVERPGGALQTAPTTSEVAAVAVLQNRLTTAIKKIVIVEELLNDETLLSSDPQQRQEQEQCAAKLRDAAMEQIHQEVLACIELSQGGGVSAWDLVDHAKSLDAAANRTFRMRGLDKSAEPARETFIKLGGLVIDMRRFDQTNHSWLIDSLDAADFQPPP